MTYTFALLAAVRPPVAPANISERREMLCIVVLPLGYCLLLGANARSATDPRQAVSSETNGAPYAPMGPQGNLPGILLEADAGSRYNAD